ncbi:MAG: hypothetical protein C0412_12020 [Flavobacterium sp.]|nr:hypothetical protein [Flavobacterium sp.]
MKNLLLVAVLTGLGIALITSCSFDNRRDSKEFKVKQGGTVELDLKTGGGIIIEGWNKDIVSVDIKIKGYNADNISYNIDQNGNTVSIKTNFIKRLRINISDVIVTVNVPNKFNVEFSTMGGEVSIASVEGNMKGKTMGGELDLRNLKGYLDIITMGGEITLKDSEVDGRVKTLGGEVFVENVKGDVNASSMGGDVKYSNVSDNKISVSNEVNINTMGGDLKVDNAPNGAKLHTMGGDITVNHADKYVKAKTMGGEVKIKEVDGFVEATSMGGDVEVKMIGDPKDGKRDATLTSMSGDVTLIVPAGLSMDIDIELAYTKKYSDCKIISDFNIKEDRTKEWNDDNGTPRKYIYGKGSIGGGKNKITIHTIDGNVYLKKG